MILGVCVCVLMLLASDAAATMGLPTIDGDLSDWDAQHIYASGTLGGDQIGTGELYMGFSDDDFYLAYHLTDNGGGDDYLYAFSGGFWFPDPSNYNSSSPLPTEHVLTSSTLELRQSWTGVRGSGATYGEWYMDIVSNNARWIIRFGNMSATSGDVNNLDFYAGTYDGNDPFPGSYITNDVDKDGWIMTGFDAGDPYFGQYQVPSAAPIPEPISMIFFGTGVVGVFGYVARRRMRSRD